VSKVVLPKSITKPLDQFPLSDTAREKLSVDGSRIGLFGNSDPGVVAFCGEVAFIVGKAVSRLVGAGCQSGPLGFWANPKSAESALVLKEGKLSSFLGYTLTTSVSSSCSSSGLVREVRVNVDKGVRNALPALDGLELGFVEGNS
jgi:hypothetical protein